MLQRILGGNVMDRETIKQLIADARDRLDDMVLGIVETEMKKFVESSSKKYPRHKFTAMIAHGSVILDVSPSVGGRTELLDIDARHNLYHEAKALHDFILSVDDIVRCNGVSDTKAVES